LVSWCCITKVYLELSRVFWFICKTEQIETLSAWQKESEHYKIWGTQYLFHGGV
jgi:hypothetical protein